MKIKKKIVKVRINTTVTPEVKSFAAKFAKEKYGTTLSGLVEALLTDFVDTERLKTKVHIDQGALI